MVPMHLILAAAVLAAGPPQETREEAAARRVREYAALISAGSPAEVRAYADTAFGERLAAIPLDRHIGFVMNQWVTSRGLELHGIQQNDGELAVARVRARLTGDWRAVAVRIEAAAPWRLTAIGLRPPEIPADLEERPPSTDPDRVAYLKEYLARLDTAGAFSGTVLLARDGKVLFARAYGEAHKGFAVPNRLDTRFNLGSMNKMFTAVAIAQLVEQRKLSYDDSLAKFLPDFPNPEDAGRIRIEHLLTHTSGLSSYFNQEFMDGSRARWRTVDDFLTLAEGDSLAFEPGTRWRYSNTGFLVLGKVVEVVTGQDYHEYVREHITGPAGMAHTEAYELDRVQPNLAEGYEREWADDGSMTYRNNLFQHVVRGGPAGGGYSTVEDLFRFAEALEAGRLVSPATVRTLTTPKPEIGSPSYGYGFGAWADSEITGHSGGFVGISSNLDIFTESGYVAVVMSNYSDGSGPVVSKIRWLLGTED